VDSRSDLYALGVTFYQMLTGVLPFSANDPMEWVHCHIARQPEPPSHLVPDLPGALSELVLKLMAKTAEERYQGTAGLEADLKHCLTQWASDGRVDPFRLGEHDVPGRLMIAEKLYGRQSAIETLLAAFSRVVANSRLGLVLISGYSGLGKTSLVKELHKGLVSTCGFFAAGKFDQYKRDVPYATLVLALQALVRQILGESEAEVIAWRHAIQEAVKPNGQLIVDLIPEVGLIIGKQPLVPEMPPKERQNCFQMALRRFLAVFTRQEHPLVLFLDDLQWVDVATLDLIVQWATGPEVRNLLLIGAYRDNELGPAHPLRRMLEVVREAELDLCEIVLAPLTIDDVGSLIGEALHCERERAFPLARLVHEKTGGNPFFAIQFLTALAEANLLGFDSDAKCWAWDLAQIHAKGYTDNVVDLMVGKLGRLADVTLETLEHFACLGNVADIATLAAVNGLSEAGLDAALWEAVRAGLVLHQEKTYSFMHDRVQEAAYSLVSEAHRRDLHLQIGRSLLAQFPQEVFADRVFDVVDQFNRSLERVTDEVERETVRRLNTAAGQKARRATAFAPARRYLEQAKALLPPDAWNECYAETLALHQNLAECEYLLGHFQRADALLTAVLESARNTLDLAGTLRLRMRLYQLTGRFPESLEVVFEALRLFGVTFPENDAEIRIATEAEHRLVSGNMGGRRLLDLLDAPLVSDAETRTLIGLIVDGDSSILAMRPQIHHLWSATAVNICLKRGHADEAPFVYASYASSLASYFRDPQTARGFFELAVELSARAPGSAPVRGKVLLLHAINGIIWCEHLARSLPVLEQAFRACLDAGDLVFAGYVTYHAIWLRWENGDPLERVVEFARHDIAFSSETHNDVAFQVNCFEMQFALSLQGKTRSLTDFSDASFDEASTVRTIERMGFGVGKVLCYLPKQIAAFLDERFDEALEWADRITPWLDSVARFMNGATHCFFHALTLAALHAQAPAERQRQFKQAMEAMLGSLKFWMGNCPENFANRYFLVAAEMARIEGRDLEAMRLYDQAIRSARGNDFVHHEALAAEVAARFYRGRGYDRIADAYLCDARDGYARWGAQGKVRQMEQHFPQLRGAPTFASNGTFATGALDLDSIAVIRALQAVSGEILLDNLLKTLMRIVLEYAGARQGHLLLARDGDLRTVASARDENQDIVVALHDDPERSESELPASILNYVRRSRNKVLLDDATATNPYSADGYFLRQRPRSVLCFPIVRQTNVIGLLYLENDLVTHAFTPERLAVLELLAAQAAISLENARLYGDLYRLNDHLEERVQERTARLAAANKELEAFGYTVSHDLRAPLRHIDGYVQLLVSRCRAGLTDTGLHYADTIAHSAREMGVLIDDLLQFSRTGRTEMHLASLDMNQALQEALIPLQDLCAGRSIEWVLGELPSVRGDFAMLRRVWANLLENALKFTRQKGTARIEVKAREENDEITFSVSDNGVGFEMKYADKLFGVFQRLHAQEQFEGTGIGLATVQRLVTRHGGRIWAKAEQDQGATFYFTLPKQKEKSHA
jgi:predicted ATPase/signal transduction histidine kinase